MRFVLLWLVLFAVYVSTLGTHAVGGSEYGDAEPHHLLAAASVVSDGDLNLADEHAERAYSRFYPYALEVHGHEGVTGLHPRYGVGLPLLIAPAYRVAGARGVEIFLAAVAALGFVVALALARLVVPEPWATRGVAVVGLSPPAVAYGAAVYPELVAGALLATAILLAVRAREDARIPPVMGSGLALAALPWLGAAYVVVAVPVAAALLHWTLRQRRHLAALIAAEVVSGSLIAYVTVNEALYGALVPPSTPGADPSQGGADLADRYLERLPRLAALWLDRDHGIVRWAPVLALVAVGGWLLWRSKRDRISFAWPARREAEAVAAMALAVCGTQLLVATLVTPTMSGSWFPGRHMAAALPVAAILVAWALRHAPRVGFALAALTVLATTWLLVDLRTGSPDTWAAPDTAAPWGPLERFLPAWGTGSVWADAVSMILVAALVVLATVEWRAAGTWRAARAAARSSPSG
jgi:hypothetical protein